VLPNIPHDIPPLPQLLAKAPQLSPSISLDVVVPNSQFYIFEKTRHGVQRDVHLACSTLEMWIRHVKEKFLNGLRVYRWTKECQAEETSMQEEAALHDPSAMHGIQVPLLLDLR
jgi:hypothetical protein